ncbi:tetratricopeptide repeat protein [candidate division KSB1 bacterium]|nr:tetratricopeptide repeat protein [candidate division KSB1 bacterium]
MLLASLPSLADQNPNAAMEKSSEKLFLEARSSFEDKDYWDAARDLIILIDFNANYSRTDEVLFLLGECLYEIGLQNSAAKLYRHLLTKYLRSPFLPRAMLGLQRTEYDRKDFARCIEYHNAISRSNAPRPVMDASYYFAGLSYYTVRDFPRAIDLLDKLSSKSPYYEYGQYTLALSYLRMKNVRKAINTFKDICTLTIESDERRNIVDETHLTLGYLYYELGFYEQAGEHFRNVSSNHAHYDAALLAAGWSSIQLGDQLQAITPLTSLVTLYPEKENTEEALFLLGHCYLKLQIYDGALKVYDQLISMFPNRDIIPAIIEEVQSNLLDESITIEKMKTELLVLESNFLDALPLNEADGAVPEHLKEERALLIEARQNLMARIQEERKKFEELTYKMELLQQMTKRRQSRRDWRAFAEYGKSRVLFLQSLQ